MLAKAYMNCGRMILTLLYIPLAVILFFCEPLLLLLGQNPEVSAYAQIYMRIALPGVFCYS